MRNLSVILLFGFLSCTVTKKVNNGEMAYRLKQFPLAVELLEKEYNDSSSDKEKARKAHLLAKSYDMLLSYGDALLWYDIADQLSYNAETEIELANALKRNERYRDAQTVFSNLYKKTKDQKYRVEAELCRQATDYIEADVEEYVIQPISSNTKYAEYSPVFYEDDFLVFSSDKPESTGGKEYKTTGNYFSDLYVLGIKGRKIYNFDPNINSDLNEGAACFNADFSEIFFTRCYSEGERDQKCKLYFSMKPNDFWVDPEPLPFFDEKTSFGQPALIENDSVLVFTVKDNSTETYDLYYSVRLVDGWSEAEIMPSSINTEGNEKFPTSYGDTLYFSSDHLTGYGGLDIFKTYLRPDGSWSKPVNMGIPINSGADDFGFIVDPTFKPKSNILHQGYFTTSRNTGFGDDIFFYAQYEKDEDNEPIEEDEVVTEAPQYSIYLAGRVVNVRHENDDPNGKVIGKDPLENAKVKITGSDTLISLRSDDRGRFLLEINPGNYDILASKKDFLTNGVETLLSRSLQSDTTVNVEIPLEAIVYNTEIVLQNIYYDFDKWDIRNDAQPTLDSLYDLLVINPEIKIQLSSHTDCQGEYAYNNNLSQKRAQSAVNYLREKGIARDRLQAIGYGESRPSVRCNCDDCTDEQHQVNRRTTFTILQ